MATRFQNSPNVHGRTPSYYANHNLYPGSYARNEYQTRVSRRMHEGLSIDRNYGLDTTSDDLNSSPYSSPYYVNGRYNSQNLTTQTGNSASVQGTTRLLTMKDEVQPLEETQTTILIYQGKQIRFEMPYTKKIVGNTIRLRNKGGCTGILSIYVSATHDGPILAETAIDLCGVSQDEFEERTLYMMTPIDTTAAPRGKLCVRMEIWDEVSCQRGTNPFNTGRMVELDATGYAHHGAAVYRLGEKNRPVRENLDFGRKSNRPVFGWVYNEWSSIPVNRIEGVDYGATVSTHGYLYDIFAIKNDREAQLVVYDRQTNQTLVTDIPVDARAEAINLVQAANYIYYVDGYSPLRRLAIGLWLPERVTSANDPVIGASLITFHCNRIWLAGFRNDPNLVQYSEITDSGPEYENFLWRFYVPDQSPLATSDNPITAMVEYQADRLMIANAKGFSLYATSADPATELPQQVSTHSDGAGVASAGDIVSYRGIIYSFDPDEGIRRFTGSLWNKIPAALDSHIERVDMTKPRKLWGYAYKLYFNYTDSIDGKAKCMIWDMAMNYQQYPWFQDIDIPFCDVRASDDFNLIGIHPDFPCIMGLYAADTWRRLDTPIVFRRDSKFLSLPGNSADIILKRIFAKVIANADRWWWFGLSFDKDNLTPDRGVHAWYRMPSWNTKAIEGKPQDPFYQEDIYEQYATSLMPIPNLNTRAISVQVRTQVKTFRAQANFISLLLEGQARQYN